MLGDNPLPAAAAGLGILGLLGLFAWSRNRKNASSSANSKLADPVINFVDQTFILWSLAHVLARGELGASVFFGAFLVLAALGARLMDERKARTLGEDWQRFAAVTSYFPFVAILQGRNRFDAREIGLRNPAIGLALYALFFWFHPALFGIRAY